MLYSPLGYVVLDNVFRSIHHKRLLGAKAAHFEEDRPTYTVHRAIYIVSKLNYAIWPENNTKHRPG